MSATIATIPAAGYAALSAGELRDRLHGQMFTLDVETEPQPDAKYKNAGLLWHQNRVLGLSLTNPDKSVAVYLPFVSEAEDGAVLYDPARAAVGVSFIRELAAYAGTTIIGHNLKFDLHCLGINPAEEEFRAAIEDTSVMVHLLDSRARKALELAEVKYLHTHRKLGHLERHGKTAKKISRWAIAEQAAYCIDDGFITWELRHKLWPFILKHELLKLFRKEMRYLACLWEVERWGVAVEPDLIAGNAVELGENEGRLERQLWELVGHEFNWRSHPQLSNVLYKELLLPWPKNPFAGADGIDRSKHAQKGKYNKYRTSAYILQNILNHPACGLVLAAREARKLGATVRGWLELMDNEPALHTSFNQVGTRTGRLSSSTPNLQNVASDARVSTTQTAWIAQGMSDVDAARRTGAFNLRSPIIARPGYQYVSIDMKQQEIRLFGILSGDEVMLKALNSGQDVHRQVATAVWGIGDDLHREWAKTVSFGMIYGMTPGSLRYRLNMTLRQAHNVMSTYLMAFPSVGPWMDEVIRQCRRDRFVRYWDGRIWRLDFDENAYVGVNAQVQGGAAGLLSIAALRCANHIKKTGSGRLVLLVHDELIFEIAQDALEDEIPILEQLMQVEDIFGRPFPCDVKVGPSYGQFHKWEPAHVRRA